MKLNVIKDKTGRVIETKPAELTDLEKTIMAVYQMFATEKVGNLGKRHYSVEPKSVKMITMDKTPTGEKTFTGYPGYSYNVNVTFRTHMEYNPQKDGSWGSHKFVNWKAFISFVDSDDKQIQGIYAIKLNTFKKEVVA